MCTFTGCNKFCIDKNYGGILIIWDRIFGTFQTEKPYVKILYGLIDNPTYFNIFYQQVRELLSIGNILRINHRHNTQ